ncbi:uncharacterized protein EDB91DRAFT_1146152 [Suillus paluster]|uniref:uncharacterized protein n=1 Tax=Suillus paluster TaxID=48578 RepID=UPI001B871994|nr:uncharacterized protein EDB91DRAFT_1146152 [Suillus paluster]KAG1734954.1 hypothetical protein EDB91DRAFT_1146152 [Suillus paluster]
MNGHWDIDIERPKFWSSKEGRVYDGAQTALHPISAKTLLGKYYFVWEGDQLYEELNPDKYDGWLTLTCEGDSKLGALDNIHGSGSFGCIFGHFKGLSIRHHITKDKNSVEIPNSWALLKSTLYEDFDEESDADDSDTGMHEITALEVQDDNGHPFIEFVYEAGWSGCCPQYLTYIGKMQVDEGRREGLSEAERSRLGMNIETKEVERTMKEKDILVQSQPSGSSIAGAMKRKVEEQEDGEEPDGKQRPSVKPKLEHA